MTTFTAAPATVNPAAPDADWDVEADQVDDADRQWWAAETADADDQPDADLDYRAAESLAVDALCRGLDAPDGPRRTGRAAVVSGWTDHDQAAAFGYV